MKETTLIHNQFLPYTKTKELLPPSQDKDMGWKQRL